MTHDPSGKLLELAAKKDARAMRKWCGAFICPRGIRRVQRLRGEASALRARAALQATEPRP